MSMIIFRSRWNRAGTHLLLSLLLLLQVACTTGTLQLPFTGRVQYLPSAYLTWLRSADTEALQQEQTLLENANSKQSPLVRKTQLALLLSARSNSTVADNATAVVLLTDALAATQGATTMLENHYFEFAEIWLDHLQLLQTRQQLGAELRSYQQKNAELEQEIDRLTQTIETFSAIEKQLLERELKQVTP